MVKSKKANTTWLQTRWSARIKALREKREEQLGEYVTAPTLDTFARPGTREKLLKIVTLLTTGRNKFASLKRDAEDPERGQRKL